MLTKIEYFISDKEQTIAVDIKSNFNFEVKMPNVDWISIAPSTKSMSSHTLYYISVQMRNMIVVKVKSFL